MSGSFLSCVKFDVKCNFGYELLHHRIIQFEFLHRMPEQKRHGSHTEGREELMLKCEVHGEEVERGRPMRGNKKSPGLQTHV